MTDFYGYAQTTDSDELGLNELHSAMSFTKTQGTAPGPRPPSANPPPVDPETAETVSTLRKSGQLKTNALEQALLRVERTFFGQSDDILPPNFYCELFEGICVGLKPEMSILIVNPSPGYATCVAALLVPRGVVCTAQKHNEDTAKNVEAFVHSYKSRYSDAVLPVIQQEDIDPFKIDSTNRFDRILVVGDCCCSSGTKKLKRLLNIGGRMALVKAGSPKVYERESSETWNKTPLNCAIPKGIKKILNTPVLLTSSASFSFQPVLGHTRYAEGSVGDFLQKLNLDRFIPKFDEAEILDMKTLSVITDSDMVSMGIPLGPRRLIANELDKLSKAPKMSECCPNAEPAVVDTKKCQMVDAVPQKRIGCGNFGDVWQGVWNGTTPVAMKTIASATETQMREFISEVCLLKNLRHPNIMQYFGMTMHKKAPYMVMELASGSVLSLIQSSASLCLETLLGMSLSCAAGMKYLASVNIVHRDLAARNLLYFSDGGTYTVKVADFGLARVVSDSNYYTMHSKVFPVRWTAIEAIAYKKFTSQSDVWSFGVMMWELMTRGMEPYAGLASQQVLPFLQGGERLPQPQDCPDEVFNFIKKCWEANPSERPTFSDIYPQLEKLISDMTGMKGGKIKRDPGSECSVCLVGSIESVAAALTPMAMAQNFTLCVYAGTGNAGYRDGSSINSDFNAPMFFANDPDGGFFVSDYSNHTIRHVSSIGQVKTIAGLAGNSGNANGTGASARFIHPRGIAVDPKTELLFVADHKNNTIRTIDREGSVKTLSQRVEKPWALCRCPKTGDIIVGCKSQVYRIAIGSDGSTSITHVAGSDKMGFKDGATEEARFSTICGVAVCRITGNIAIADRDNNRIRIITPYGAVETLAGSGEKGGEDGVCGNASFDHPHGLCIDRNGTIFVADKGSGHIRKVTKDGLVGTLRLPFKLNGPTDVLLSDARGSSIFVTEHDGNRISKISPAQ